MFKLSVGQLLYMKPKNNQPTEVYCIEDLFKLCLFGHGNFLYISNTISPKIVELFSEIFNIELIVIYFDYQEYNSEFAKTHVKNGLVEFKLNKKFIIYKQTYKYLSKNKYKFMTTMLDHWQILQKQCCPRHWQEKKVEALIKDWITPKQVMNT